MRIKLMIIQPPPPAFEGRLTSPLWLPPTQESSTQFKTLYYICLGKALDVANYGLFKNSGRPDALKFLVVIAQTKSTDDVNRAARDLRNSAVNILSAWSGKRNSHRDDLQSIVSPPKHYNLFGDGGSSVDKLALLIVKRIRHGMFWIYWETEKLYILFSS